MAKDEFQKCPECGTPVGLGENKCRNGHLSPTVFGDTCALDSEVGRLEIPDSSLTGRKYLENTLFECVRCNRLLETQVYHERPIAPRFCAWCGKPVSPLIGREIDGYRIDEVLAKGGFGYIYLASNISQPKMKQVVKFLRPQMAYSRPELVRIFVEEARLTEEIGQTCWNVVRVSNVREKPWPYYFMEYVRGTTLDELIENLGSKKIPLHDCKGYLRGIAKALATTHSHRRVHRDLKPLNIMVIKSQEIPPEERIKFLDFGLAMRIAKANMPPTNLSGTGFSAGVEAASPVQSAGTPEYMAPEAYDGITEFSGDIYSFGVTAYEILTGKRPWDDPPPDGERFIYWRDAHKKKPPRPIRELRTDCPNWLAKVVMKCLEKNPQNRIRDAEPLSGMLREPVPLWAKAVSAALTVVFAVLVTLVFLRGKDPSEVSWKDGEVPFSNPLTLWVKGEEDLPKREVLAVLGTGKKVKKCWSSSKDVEVVPIDNSNSIRVKFLKSFPLSSNNLIRIFGSGDDNLQVEGAISIAQDLTAPVVDDLKFVDLSQGTAAQLQPILNKPRLQPAKVRIVATVTEDNFRLVSLRGEDDVLGHQGFPVDKEVKLQEFIGGGHFYTFNITDLPASSYRVKALAEDLAGNKGSSKSVDFIVDSTAEIDLPSPDLQTFLVKGWAYYKFKLKEALKDIKVFPSETQDELPFKIYSADKVSRSLDLIKLPKAITVGELEVGPNYLLSLPLKTQGEPGMFQLQLEDRATPPNKNPRKIEFHPPDALKDGVVSSISITVANKNPSGAQIHLDTEKIDGKFRAKMPTASSRLREVTMEVSAQRVFAAKCKTNDCAAIVDDDKIVFQDLALVANVVNDFLFTLYDAMERPFEVHLIVRSDTIGPEIEIQYDEFDKVHHKIDSWRDVKLAIKSKEGLSKACATFSNKKSTAEPIFGKGDKELGPNHFVFDLSRLTLDEGEYTLRIDAWDEADNLKDASQQVFVNTGAPKVVVPQASKAPDDKTLHLKSDLLLVITDGNGVSQKNGVVSFDVPNEPKPPDVSIPPPTDENMYKINLEALSEKCKGELTVKVWDELGLLREVTFPFTFVKPEPRWPEIVKWKGITWVLVPGEVKFYISRCEISNAVFNDKEFIQDGRYVKPIGKYEKPKYWRDRGSPSYFPTYSKDKKKADGGPYPVIGISPQEAKAFGEKVLGARLPSWEEWQAAAWKENRGGPYPWKTVEEGDEGKDFCNLNDCWTRPESPYHKKGYGEEMQIENGDAVPCRVVEVGFDPFKDIPNKTKDKLGYSGEILHLIGNVGEIVSYGKKYAIAGGDWNGDYDEFKITDQNPPDYTETSRSARVGFRLAIPLDKDWRKGHAKKEFLEKIKESSKQ